MNKPYPNNRLKELRLKKNLLQSKVALDINVTQETVSAYETGRVLPSSDMLITLATYYNTSIDYILCRTDFDMRIDDVKPSDLSKSDFNHLSKYRSLSKDSQNLVDTYIQALVDKES